mmetsp:Transcript_2934/g.4431  ORF Transcript_2934/g.4431 Transcript_2934/m.4431 type:complete len:100 (+) Transcript_2934:696-995(+)
MGNTELPLIFSTPFIQHENKLAEVSEIRTRILLITRSFLSMQHHSIKMDYHNHQWRLHLWQFTSLQRNPVQVYQVFLDFQLPQKAPKTPSQSPEMHAKR